MRHYLLIYYEISFKAVYVKIRRNSGCNRTFFLIGLEEKFLRNLKIFFVLAFLYLYNLNKLELCKFHLSLSLSLSLSLPLPLSYLSFPLYISPSTFLSLSLLSIILFGVSNGRFRPCFYYNLTESTNLKKNIYFNYVFPL